MKMTKMTKIIALLALSVLMLMCVCACGKKDGDSGKKGDALEGTWYFQSPDYGDVTATFDGNGKMTWGYDCGFTYSDEGTYQIQDGGKITLKLDGWTDKQVATYTLDGNTLTITSELGGMNGTYTKK
ncbi:MAG: lipocalin family protein [Lachnospiraceae bacterium]|nr:lipocalin family protein [Lachnospiraceae bacterium]